MTLIFILILIFPCVGYRGATMHVFLHEEAVYGLSMDPLNDNVFASACDDGRVLIWDIREPSTTGSSLTRVLFVL